MSAAKQYINQFDHFIESKKSFVTESTLSGKTIENKFRRLRRHDFRVKIIFLFVLDVSLCVDRVQARVQAGGHPVPETDIRRRFERSITNFWDKYRFLSDIWVLL
jgi:predicted ABC-type ATPase